MSLQFPAPVAQQWSWTWPIKKTPYYATAVQAPSSGRGEVRVGLMVYPRWNFELNLNYLKGDFGVPSSALATVAGFFMQAQGKLLDWLYQDPSDNSVTNEPFGAGDGTTTAFQLIRSVGTVGVDVVQNLNGTPTIYVAGTPTTPASIGSTGIVTFTAAPASGAALTWTGDFYFRCRFADDQQGALQEDMSEIWSMDTLKFVSVIL